MLPSMLFPHCPHLLPLLVGHDSAHFFPAATLLADCSHLLDLLVAETQVFAHALHALGGITATLIAFTVFRLQAPGGTRQQDHAEGKPGYALHMFLHAV
jgi:hypothetical protein